MATQDHFEHFEHFRTFRRLGAGSLNIDRFVGFVELVVGRRRAFHSD